MFKIGNTSFSKEVFNLTKKEFFEKFRGKLNTDITEAWKTVLKHKKLNK